MHSKVTCTAGGQQPVGADSSHCFQHICKHALQVRMTQDIPGDGYYFSAVKAFITRTAYANIRGDQMVGWANSSLRAPKDLPDVSNIKGKGIVLETPLEDALHSSNRVLSSSKAAAGNTGITSRASSKSRGDRLLPSEATASQNCCLQEQCSKDPV